MDLTVSRTVGTRTLQAVGTLHANGSFTYAPEYLAADTAAAISFSLPLRKETYSEAEAAPYFKGLLPEGRALARLAGEAEFRPDDYVSILSRCGLDCVGDVVINPEAYSVKAYEAVTLGTIFRPGQSSLAMSLRLGTRLSLAGTQDKTSLYQNPNPDAPQDAWYLPKGGAPSNYIAKACNPDLPTLLVNEHLCMTAARTCGIACANTRLVKAPDTVLVAERFDRTEYSDELISGMPAPLRRHQEDFAQAFGVPAGEYAKYEELEGGSAGRIAAFLRAHSTAPAKDVTAFASLMLFNYAIGNCDNHLKNHSVLYGKTWSGIRLAPAYDLISTAIYARFSDEMGMNIGTTRVLKDIRPEDFSLLAEDLQVSPALLKKRARTICDSLCPALNGAGRALEEAGWDEAPIIVDKIETAAEDRLATLQKFAAS